MVQRFVSPASVAVGLAVALSAQAPLESRFAPPPGYHLLEDEDTLGTVAFGRAEVTGRIYRARYEFPVVGGAPSHLVIARHYAAQVKALGGSYFESAVEPSQARFAARVPGAKPLFLRVTTETDGYISSTLLEEDAPASAGMPVQEDRIPGLWHPASAQSHVEQYRPADRQVMSAFQSRVAAMFGPAFVPPVGHSWEVMLQATYREADEITARSGYVVAIAYFRRYQFCPTCPVEQGAEVHPFLELRVNDPFGTFEADPETDADDKYFVLPELEPAGPQVWSMDDGDRILVVRAGRPPLWLTVTREAHLQARIRLQRSLTTGAERDLDQRMKDTEEMLRRLEQIDPAAARAARAGAATAKEALGQPRADLDDLEKELAELSAEARRAPAVTREGRPIVRFNPAFLDPSLPPAGPQFLLLSFQETPRSSTTLYKVDLMERIRRDVTHVRLLELVR